MHRNEPINRWSGTSLIEIVSPLPTLLKVDLSHMECLPQCYYSPPFAQSQGVRYRVAEKAKGRIFRGTVYITEEAGGCQKMALFGPRAGPRRCPFIGLDRKSAAPPQNDAPEPRRQLVPEEAGD